MLVSHLVINFLSLIVQSIITWLNGVVPTLGMFPDLLLIHIVYIVYRPTNKELLFNLWHASARNVIEHIFGVLKCCFWILLLAPEYSLQVQARIPAAFCVVDNFIKVYDPAEDDINDHHDNYNNPTFDHDQVAAAAAAAEIDTPSSKHNHIAQDMWDDYQVVLQDRQGNDLEDSDLDEEVDEWVVSSFFWPFCNSFSQRMNLLQKKVTMKIA